MQGEFYILIIFTPFSCFIRKNRILQTCKRDAADFSRNDRAKKGKVSLYRVQMYEMQPDKKEGTNLYFFAM